MRLTDLRNYGIVLIVGIILNSFIDVVPWFPHFGGLVALLLGILLYDKAGGEGFDFTFSSIGPGQDNSSGVDLQVEPVEAPEKLNQKVRDHPGRRELNIDRTDRDNLDYYDEYREVTINGEEKGVWGVIGRPRNPSYGELIAYIYDLSEDRIRRYQGNVQGVEGRIQPFNDYTWLSVRGRDASRESGGSGRNQFIIDQSGDSPSRRPSDNGGGG